MPPSVAAAVKREIDTRASGKPKEKKLFVIFRLITHVRGSAVENTKGSRKGKNV